MPRVLRIEVSLRTLLLAVCVLAGAWLLVTLTPVLISLLVALIFAGTLDPAVQWLERRGLRRVLALVVVFGAVALVVALLGVLIFPALARQVADFAADAPRMQTRVAEWLKSYRLLGSAADDVKDFDPRTLLGGEGASKLVSLSGGVIEFLGYLASSLVLALYLVADRERMRGTLYAVVPRSHHVRLAHILSRMELIVGGYMRGQLITSVAIFLFTFMLLSVLQVPGALALAAFAGLTDVIPYVGGLLATAPATLASFSVSTWAGVVVLVVLAAYQEFESRVLVPAVYGRILRLPSVVVLLALLVGGRLLGIIGALLALPVAAMLRMLIEEMRVELPGETTDTALKEHDERAQREYEAKTEGVPAEAAAEVAGQIAEKTPGEKS